MHKSPCSSRDYSGNREVTPLHRGERVGDDDSEVVDVSHRHDGSPDNALAPLGERGRGREGEKASLLLLLLVLLLLPWTSPLMREGYPPLVHGLPGPQGAGAPLD
jgi:hypothetical protein